MTMHPMTNQCSIASRVLPPGVHLGTDLSVVTWLLTTDHVHPDLSVTWSTCHPASGPRDYLLLTLSTTDDRPDHLQR